MDVLLTAIFGIPLAVLLAYLVIRRGKQNNIKLLDEEDTSRVATITEQDPDKFDAAIAKGWQTLREQPAGTYATVRVQTGDENHTLKIWKPAK